MHHGCKNECQFMFAEVKRLSVRNNYPFFAEIRAEKVLHHRKRFFIRNNGRVRIRFQEIDYICRVIGLHVLNNKIIRAAGTERGSHIVKPLVREVCIHGVHNRDFIVENDIRVVGHSVRNYVLSLKKVNIVVIHTHINYIISYSHSQAPFGSVFQFIPIWYT